MPPSTPGLRLLNLGCGHRFHPDWVNVDIAPQHPSVMKCDLSRGLPFADESFDVVYHSALLEHFRREDARPFLQECQRVLKPGGLIRVATPDLERICELYLAMLRALPGSGAEGAANHEWMTLELFDQCVREQPGGGMLEFLRRVPLLNEQFVLDRIGEEGRGLLAMIRAAQLPPAAPASPRAHAIGQFRLAGEVHHWMYDRVSLARLLAAAGFSDPVLQTATGSALAGWKDYHLDTTAEGAVTKPDSFYLEARKSTDAPAIPAMRSRADDALGAWLETLPRHENLMHVSPVRAYAHAEEQYDAQYGVTSHEPEEGQGLCALLETHGVDTTGPALEVGCGTGYLTYGLAKHYPGPDFLITDPSETFLRLTQRLLGTALDFPPRLHFAVLNADDLAQLPPATFALIAMRSTLHHILDVEGFIAASARALRPEGALAMGAEPCESGYVMMGLMGQAIAPLLESAGVTLLPSWQEQLRTFLATVKFYCRRDLDKKKAEDKHLFNPHELTDLGRRHGLQLRYFPNASFSDYAPPELPQFQSFSIFFLNYLKYSMKFDAEFLQLIRRHLKSRLKYLDECYSGHVGPPLTGVFLFQKSGDFTPRP